MRRRTVRSSLAPTLLEGSGLDIQARKHAWSFRTVTILFGVVTAAFCAVLIPHQEEADHPSLGGVACPPQWMPVFVASTGILPSEASEWSPLSGMSTSADLQIELIVNEKPAVAAMRFVAGALKYHIVAFNQRTQYFSHLVHTGGRSYRFTSTNGGYTPSGTETIGCTVEISEESAEVVGGLPNGLTVSQLSQQARSHPPHPPTRARDGTPPCLHTRLSLLRSLARSSSMVTRASRWSR